MSQNIDEILRELSDLSFEPSEEPSGEKLPDGDWPHGGHTPSVTETLMAVRELIGEPASMEEKAEALDDVVESLEEPAPEKLSLTKSVQQEIPAEETPLSTSQETPKAPSGKQKVKKSRIRLSGSPSRSPSRSPSQNPSQSPSQSLPQSRHLFYAGRADQPGRTDSGFGRAGRCGIPAPLPAGKARWRYGALYLIDPFAA